MKYIKPFLLLAAALYGLLFLDIRLGRKANRKKGAARFYPDHRGDLTILTDGKALYKDLFAEIRAAEEYVHAEFFIINNDEISKQFLELLMEKAATGVTVRLLFDRLGGYKLTGSAIRLLRSAGVQFSFSNQPSFPFFFYKLMSRNHRKIVIVDGQVGYIGGFNIGNQYIDGDPVLSPWRDYNIKFTGSGVGALQKEFLRDWEASTQQMVEWTPPSPLTLPNEPVIHSFLATDGRDLEEQFRSFIQKATHSIIIGTPYFIPGIPLLQDLLAALKRGVSVSIIVPRLNDHPLVKEAGYRYYRKLLPAGAKVYQYEKGFYHTKLILIDDSFADVGTANFDQRSMHYNFEINCLTENPKIIDVLAHKLREDMANSSLLTIEELRNKQGLGRIRETIATLLSPFL